MHQMLWLDYVPDSLTPALKISYSSPCLGHFSITPGNEVGSIKALRSWLVGEISHSLFPKCLPLSHSLQAQLQWQTCL